MKNIIGPPVIGDDFFGRDDELNFVWSLIESGNNIVLPSPRRVGKTSFALRIIEIAQSKGWNTISINMEKNSGEQDFVETFVEELKKLSTWEKVKDKGNKLLDLLKQFKPSIEQGDVKVTLDWQIHKEDAYHQLANLLDQNKETLIFLDELTALLNTILKQDDGLENTIHFMHWMREFRQNKSKIRWLFCSSVGIENFTHTYGIGNTMNDTQDYALRSFNPPVSSAMLSKLSTDNNLPLSDELQSAIINKLIYCTPYFLQLMFLKINFLHTIESKPLDDLIVEIAFKELTEEKHFNTWIERIDEQYGDLKNYAFSMLRHICQEKTGTKRTSLENIISKMIQDHEEVQKIVSKLLYMLKNDGYLIEENGLHGFRSPLLREFWYNRFVQ